MNQERTDDGAYVVKPRVAGKSEAPYVEHIREVMADINAVTAQGVGIACEPETGESVVFKVGKQAGVAALGATGFYRDAVQAAIEDDRVRTLNARADLWPCDRRDAHGPHHPTDESGHTTHSCPGVKIHPACIMGRL